MFTKNLYKIPSWLYLASIITLSLVPFLPFRVLRMAGDEKVYVSTAIEMFRAGNWFVQTLADQPDYYKGPMHYLFSILGLKLFGNSLFSALWMNWALLLISSLFLFRALKKRWDEKSAFLISIACALNIGIVSHAYASQMEVEVYSFFIFALSLLINMPREVSFKKEAFLWIIIGIVGWSKSPVHSFLLGVGSLFFYLITNQLFTRLKNKFFWISLVLGISFGFLGYLPAAFLDSKNFYDTYILREQFQKANNHRTWDYVITPLFHFLFPWTFIVLFGIIRFISRKRKPGPGVDTQLFKLGLALSMPWILFWAFWTYKGQNYNLPALPGLLLAGFAAYNGSPFLRDFKISSILGFISSIILVLILKNFMPLPSWWNPAWILLSITSLILFSILFLAKDFRLIALGVLFLFISFASIIIPLGEREMLGARSFIKSNPNIKIYYYNLEPSIWSEWGLLQLSLHHPIYGLHKKESLKEVLKPNQALILPKLDNLNQIESILKTEEKFAHLQYQVIPWKRWLTKGKDDSGQSLWKKAWSLKDLSILERDFYILNIKP